MKVDELIEFLRRLADEHYGNYEVNITLDHKDQTAQTCQADLIHRIITIE